MRTVTFNPRDFATTIDKNALAETKLAIDNNGLNVNFRRAVFGNVDQVARTPTNGSSANQTSRHGHPFFDARHLTAHCQQHRGFNEPEGVTTADMESADMSQRTWTPIF